MEGVYDWIRNLTGFFLFMSVIDNLLPGKQYAKYVRLFSGMILILLVLQPLTGSLRLEDRIAHYYESFVFRDQAEDLQHEILGMERQRLSQVIAQYEHAVAQDVGQMAEEAGYSVLGCNVSIDENEGTERFGCVTDISLYLAEEDRFIEPEKSDRKGIDPVEPVAIGTGPANGGEMITEESGAGYHRNREIVNSEIGKLRRKIASYYSLEERYVEIQIMEGER